MKEHGFAQAAGFGKQHEMLAFLAECLIFQVMRKDYYKELGVARDATAQDIQKAWRKAAMRYHPDRNPDPKAQERFKAIKEAYEALSDPSERAKHDEVHSRPQNGWGNMDAMMHADLFEQVFSQAFGARRTAIRANRISLTFWEAVFGCSKTMQVWTDGSSSLQKISFSFPPGVFDGEHMLISSASGNALLEIAVMDDADYDRQGLDLFLNLPVPWTVLVEGGTITVPHWEGDLEVRIPNFCREGQQLRLAGKGVARKDANGAARGDLYLVCRAIYPDKLPEKERSVFRDIAKALSPSLEKVQERWRKSVAGRWPGR